MYYMDLYDTDERLIATIRIIGYIRKTQERFVKISKWTRLFSKRKSTGNILIL